MENIINAVKKYSDVMFNARDYIWKNPEVGYKEFKTNEFMLAEFAKLGYKTIRQKDITGFTAYYDTGKPGPTVLVLAELDSLYCTDHPECNKETGAVHCCGHDLQCATILGIAGAISEQSISNSLCGRVKFCVVPAEEGIEISYRSSLVEKGIITFLSGKPECILRGMLDDVDVAFMVHAKNLTEYSDKAIYGFCTGSNGVIRKKTVVIGKASHAGGAPWDGINALYCAELIFSACNALRETFKEEDHVRFHSIITKGGDAVNAIPETVIIESYVRASNTKGMKEANFKINRAIKGACLAMGANVQITDLAGSEPLDNSDLLTKIMWEEGEKLVGKGGCVDTGFFPASTDMGDVSSVVPSVHAYVDAHRGNLHGKDYVVPDVRKSCESSACIQVATIVALLSNGGEKAYEIKNNFKPVYSSIQEYLEAKRSITKVHDAIEYHDEKAVIKLK